jgi:hypothetical protein
MNKNKTLYRIIWISSLTNNKGKGELCLTKKNAEEMLIDLNERYPFIKHSISYK